MPEPKTVNMVDPATGNTYAVDEADVPHALHQQWRVETEGETSSRLVHDVKEQDYGGAAGKVNAALLGAASTASGGLSDVAIEATGGGDALEATYEINPASTMVGKIGGAFLPTGVGGLAAKAGAGVTKLGAEAGTLGRLAARTAGGFTEGALFGGSEGVSELALGNEDITVEHVVSKLSSNMLFGGGVGGGIGLGGALLEKGLSKAKGALDSVAERSVAGPIPEDLAALDVKGLRAAKQTELDTIEAARAPERQKLADELGAFRREVKEQNHFLTTKDVKLPAADGKLGTGEIGSIARKANVKLDNLLNDPIGLVTKPAVREQAATALRLQENAWVKTLERGPELRAAFAADTTGARAAALDTLPAALEKNRALQSRLAELGQAPASQRLTHITTALDDLAAGGGTKTLAEQMLGGSAFSGTASAVRGIAGLASAIPGVGPLLGMAGHMIAPLAGAKASELVTSKVFGRMAKASADVAARTQKAVTAFLDVGKKAAPAAPVLASKVLAAVRYAPETKRAPLPKATARIAPKLADSYRERSAELRSQVTRDMTGAHVMRPEARAAMAERLAGVRAAAPVLADRMETLAARRVEFLASKLPRRPDLGIVQLGPDTWTPSDMEMRAFARYAAAVEDPGGVEERLVDGTVTPEDAEAMNAVYPERVAEIKRQIVERLPTLQKTLPYARRLALSIFTGVPVDPAMHPAVLAVLQGQFAAEPNTSGGMQAPRAQPAFGSVRAEQPTKAQAHGADQEG